jgi:mono/diheme cytochrome c family protein
MRLKYILIGFAMVLSTAMWHARADQDSGTTKVDGTTVANLIKHGEYLVNRVAQCGDCHTPRDAKGEPDPSRLLQGSVLAFAPKEKTDQWAEDRPTSLAAA